MAFAFRSFQLSLVTLILMQLGCAANPNSAVPVKQDAASSVADINRMLASMSSSGPSLTDDYRIGSEDMIQITIYNLAGVDGGVTPRDLSLRISQQGMIKLPLLGEIKVSGQTPAELEDALRQRYEKYFYDPQIAVQVKEFRSQRVYLLGAVNRAGAIDLTGPKTLIDVLAMAGGVNQKAGNQVHIYRQGPNGRETHIIDLFALSSSLGLINEKTVNLVNFPVQAGDMINVPEAGTFYVDGAVRRGGSFSLGRRYTITQAFALAGGVDVDQADNDSIRLYREVNGEMKQIPIDLSAIRAGKEPDLVLQPDDFLFVPISGLKWVWNFFMKNVGLPSPYSYIPK